MWTSSRLRSPSAPDIVSNMVIDRRPPGRLVTSPFGRLPALAQYWIGTVAQIWIGADIHLLLAPSGPIVQTLACKET